MKMNVTQKKNSNDEALYVYHFSSIYFLCYCFDLIEKYTL